MALVFVGVGFAQRSNRTSAYMYLEKGQLLKAKEKIDLAIVNPKTKEDAKTWLYYGRVYYAIASSPLPAFENLDKNAGVKSLEALKKAKELDVKHKFTKEANEYLKKLTIVFYTEGADGFKQKDYPKAIEYFQDAFKVSQYTNAFDTTAAFNIGISGVLGKNPKVAAEYLKKCIDVNFNEPRIYIYYNRALQQMGDTAAAQKSIALGRTRYPENLSLLLEEAQLYLERGEANKLINSLKEAIVKQPKNPSNANFNFLIGKSYDDMGKKDMAEDYYKKALAINPKFFEAVYNIGAIYVNDASKLQKEANNLPLEEVKAYNALNTKANGKLKVAVPWLERALQIRPTDAPTIHALKETYTRLKMNVKLKALINK